MKKEKAIEIIEQALNIANQKGAFTLADVQTIIAALTTLKLDDSVHQNGKISEEE